MADHEPGDRRVIRHQVPRDHPKRHVLTTVTLDRPRRTHLRRVREQDECHHHRRLIRRPTVTVSPIPGIERLKVHPPHSVDHEPRKMIRRQPLPHVRRQQESLLTTALNEVLRHAESLLNPPDGLPLRDSVPGRPAGHLSGVKITLRQGQPRPGPGVREADRATSAGPRQRSGTVTAHSRTARHGEHGFTGQPPRTRGRACGSCQLFPRHRSTRLE